MATGEKKDAEKEQVKKQADPKAAPAKGASEKKAPEKKGAEKKAASKKGAEKKPLKPAEPPRFKERYAQEIVPALMKKFKYSSVMQVPRVQKVVLNVGLGEATQNIKLLDSIQKELTAIAGQKAVVTKAKKAIAAFKLRKGVPIGCMVTIRGNRMFEFLDRFISLSLPRIRDFRGVSDKSFDGNGNYAIGIKEQFIFPEINYDKVDLIHGMDIVICTSARTDDEGRALISALGMPFKKQGD